ncbi:MAG TPA: hypothetical protein DCQ34_00715 [Chitinophagaceae bacterium]|nr:hypothetical protein [Chitinophagaceae bacterium]HRF27597.1 FixH family protein [Ferruginibacter sp.]
MKRISSLFVYILLSSLIVLNSCSKDDPMPPVDPVKDYVKLASGYAAGAATLVELYGLDSASSGYTKLFVALKDSVTGNYVERAGITLVPMMDMGSMAHSAPVEQPASTQAVNKLFPCSVGFIMSSMGGTWTIAVQVNNLENNQSGMVSFPIHVKESSPSRMYSFTSLVDNSSRYFVGLVEPSDPFVGINDLEFVVYKRQSMMAFPADSSLSISFEPSMPSMGHGSPNNVNPVHIGKGHYKGKVNFTMTGLWRLDLQLHSGTAVADSTHGFDIEF